MKNFGIGVVALLIGVATGCGNHVENPSADAAGDRGKPAGARVAEGLPEGVPEPGTSWAAALDDSVRTPVTIQNPGSVSDDGGWSDTDFAVFDRKVRWAAMRGLADLPFGDAVAEMGRTFLGWSYIPATLEVDGPERVVVNLEALDCVTFIENVLALVRFDRRYGAGLLERDPAAARTAYEALLREMRYRDGVLIGYPSRLHYFSEWLANNADRGLVELQTASLGGEADASAIDFMSNHPDAYRQLAGSDESVAKIREVEARLSAQPRWWIPEARIAEVAGGISEGDLIAATSTVDGLDIAHTGIAILVDGVPHLLHAPLVGRVVELSERPLSERILTIEGQDGIMVATPTPGPRPVDDAVGGGPD